MTRAAERRSRLSRSTRRPELCDTLPHPSRRSRSLPLDIVPSVCPHDCPSACALEVELIDGRRIGRVRGAVAQSYTRGVVCAKVARYAERQHHPARLSRPLRRGGGEGKSGPAVAADLLDEWRAPGGPRTDQGRPPHRLRKT